MWCSLSVRGAGVRVEALRFMLLIVLTVALASVAFRINSHSSSTSSHGRSGRPPVATNPPSSAPSGPSTAPQGTPTARTSPTHHSHPATGSGSSGTGTGGSSGGAGTPTQLPVTGWDSAMKLGAFAFLLIGGGMLSIRSAGPRRHRQRASVQD
jgi:hypothetical protein